MPENILDLKGRIALVSGAGQGVGRQVALHLAASAAGGVIVNDYFLERAQAVADEIESAGGKAIALQADVTRPEAVADLVARAEKHFGAIDILVNNAGNAGPVQDVAGAKPFWETGPDDWQHWLDTNFFGVLNCCRMVLPGMIKRRYGAHHHRHLRCRPRWRTTSCGLFWRKAGAAGFMRALAKAVGRAEITANCVALSGIRTPGVVGLLQDEETVSRILKSYMIRRLGEPSDAANLILFLSSDAASWITGQTYPVNGGYAVST